MRKKLLDISLINKSNLIGIKDNSSFDEPNVLGNIMTDIWWIAVRVLFQEFIYFIIYIK